MTDESCKFHLCKEASLSLPSFLLGFQNQIFLPRAISLPHSVLCHPQSDRIKCESFVLRTLTGKERQVNLKGWLKEQNKKLRPSPVQAPVLDGSVQPRESNMSCWTLPSPPSKIQTNFLSRLISVSLSLPNEPLNGEHQESKIRELYFI